MAMRRLAILVACAAVWPAIAAEPPPMPVSPFNPPSTEPYLERITATGSEPAALRNMEICMDPGAMARTAQAARARAQADPSPPKPLPGCTHSFEHRPDGTVHSEIACDRAAGARSSYRTVSDGTPGDMRMHWESYGFDSNTGEPKTTVRDTHLVRLGACPADLKPGQARLADGTVINIPSREALSGRPPLDQAKP